ncbi:MAG: response regulator transcription factor [Butyricicoccus pullicaecorum]|nr:response regulator transcription factor [Butyricicoccus pullicaecorum]
MNVLIIEDDRRLADALVRLMQRQKYIAEAVYNGRDGLEYARLNPYNVVVLDVGLPDLSGLEIARTLRREKNATPILMLSARSTIADRVKGLDSGADDYMAKPFAEEELLARVRALSRRLGTVVLETMEYGDLTLALDTHILYRGEQSVQLNRKEFEVLYLLMANSRIVVAKERMITRVWGYDSNAEANNVEVYLSFLRKKLRYLQSDVRIVSLRRVGYKLEYNGVKK